MLRANHSSRGILQSVGCVTECDRKASIMGRRWPVSGCCARRGTNTSLLFWAAVSSAAVLYWSAIIGHNCDPVVFLSPFAVYTPFILVPNFGMNM